MERAVFINYRGEDSHSYGALLYTELARHFGAEQVFLDAESIPAGADFVAELLGRVRTARVLLAVIGPYWLTADPTGRRRIDDPADWIRRELVAAFTAGVRVIPVLTEQVEIPAAADLPADIAALSRCQYRRLRYREPTADLTRIVTDLTSLDPALAAAARARDNAPRQLPAAPSLFTGRATELATLTDAVTTPDAGRTVVISAIGGTGGIGKTALALHWSHQNLHRFPDGQLYVDLRGFDPSGQPTPVGDAVRGFLVALGVDPATLPVEVDAQTAHYRSLVAGRRMLIVLDNARDVAQVTPLLPGSPSCTVLVTSRRHLGGLTVRGACLLDLHVLPGFDARTLLAGQLGEQRLRAEPEAAAELLAICAGLPLAVRIVAARAVRHPTFRLAVLAAELRDVSARLAGLDAGDLHTNLLAVLSWSVRALEPRAANVFALLGIAPGPDISLTATVSLADRPEGQVRAVLRELEDFSLIQQHLPGRYRMHDLIRLHARHTAHHDLTEQARETALRRVIDFYAHTAHTADQLLYPQRDPLHLDQPVPGCRPHPLPDHAAALAWFDDEHACLLAAQQTAIAHCWHQTVWALSWTLHCYHYRRGYRYDELAICRAGLAAAEQLPDPTLRLAAHRLLAQAYVSLGRHPEGIEHLNHALALTKQHHDPTNQAHIHQTLAWAWQQRDARRALEHATHALDLYRGLDLPVSQAGALNSAGWCAAQLGQYDLARTHCQAALTAFRHHHYLDGEAAALGNLGYIAQHSGQYSQALAYYQRSRDLLHQAGDMPNEALALDWTGHTYAATGQNGPAREVWREARELYRRQGRNEDAERIQQQLDDLDKGDRGRPAADVE